MKRPGTFARSDLINIFALAVQHGCSSIRLNSAGEILIRFSDPVEKPASNADFSFTLPEKKRDWADEAIEAAAAAR